MRSFLKSSLIMVVIGLLSVASLRAAQTSYYAGKTITVYAAVAPRVGGVSVARLRALLEEIYPRNPNFVMEFMDGASGRKAANYFYTVKPDGLKILGGKHDFGFDSGAVGQQLRYRKVSLHRLNGNR